MTFLSQYHEHIFHSVHEKSHFTEIQQSWIELVGVLANVTEVKMSNVESDRENVCANLVSYSIQLILV